VSRRANLRDAVRFADECAARVLSDIADDSLPLRESGDD
jgi:hypothetical protein